MQDTALGTDSSYRIKFMLILSSTSFQSGREMGTSGQFSILRQTMINVTGVEANVDVGTIQTRERSLLSGYKIQLCVLI